jgi:ABC-type nitrate/sulfonate/bicarbonate transport system permease component
MDYSLQKNRDKLLCTYTEVAVALLIGAFLGFLIGILV